MTTKGIALITGASAGIGLELAKLFAADGHDLILVARRGDVLEGLATELRQRHGITAHVRPTDLAESSAAARLSDWAAAQGLAVDILVNNAGFGALGPFADLPIERQLGIVDVNVRALTELTHRFLPAMRARRRGRILNVASVAAFLPGPYMAVYYATKAYVLSFSDALAEELAGSGITVTCLCPGFTATEFQDVAGMTGLRSLARIRPMSADAVARSGYRGLMDGQRTVVTGAQNRIGVFGMRVIPRRWLAKLTARLQAPD